MRIQRRDVKSRGIQGLMQNPEMYLDGGHEKFAKSLIAKELFLAREVKGERKAKVGRGTYRTQSTD